MTGAGVSIADGVLEVRNPNGTGKTYRLTGETITVTEGNMSVGLTRADMEWLSFMFGRNEYRKNVAATERYFESRKGWQKHVQQNLSQDGNANQPGGLQ